MHHLRTEHIDGESVRQHSEREQAWLELLHSDCLGHITLGDQLKMAETARCYRVVESIMEKRKTYGNILTCYLNDSTRHMELWSYMQKHADNATRQIYEQTHAHFEQLLEIDAVELTRLCCDHFAVNIPQLMRLLDAKDEKLFRFMEQLQRFGYALESHDAEVYLMLLCQISGDMVDAFLRTNENYRLDIALDIVRKYDLSSACIYLHEKLGDYSAAFAIALDVLREAPESLAETRAIEVSQLCTRAAMQMTDAESEHLWFQFIRLILTRPDLQQITKNILQTASGHVDLTKLVQLIMQSGGGGGIGDKDATTSTAGNFGDIKHLLLGMLSNSRYETLLLATTAKVLGKDLHLRLALEKRKASRAVSIKSVKCVVCRKALNESSATVMVFSGCGHAGHEHCCSPERCPRCGATMTDGSFELPRPAEVAVASIDVTTTTSAGGGTNSILQLAAPPRIGIGGQ